MQHIVLHYRDLNFADILLRCLSVIFSTLAVIEAKVQGQLKHSAALQTVSYKNEHKLGSSVRKGQLKHSVALQTVSRKNKYNGALLQR